MKMTRRASLAVFFSLFSGFAALAVYDPGKATTVASKPDGKIGEGWWKTRHEEKVKLAAQGGWDLVFIGDSITQGWEGGGKETWEKFYAPRKALNIGFSGDRTENVVWRLENGEMDGYKPKVAVIMIGTNNTGHRNDPPDYIAGGVKAILDDLGEKWPDTKILLLAIFPRAAQAADPQRVNNDKANEFIAKLADGKHVFYLNINDKFLAPDGELTK